MDRFVKTLRKSLFKILPQYTTLFHSHKTPIYLNKKKANHEAAHIIALHGFLCNHQQRGEIIQFFLPSLRHGKWRGLLCSIQYVQQ